MENSQDLPVFFDRPLRADLHLHSRESDGHYSPSELVEHAVSGGLELISLTDHDTLSGVKEARQTAEALGCSFVDGIELEVTVQLDDSYRSVHVLGYGIDLHNSALNQFLETLRENRIERAQKILSKLNDLSVPVSFERILELSHGESLSRVHIALAMKEAGHIDSFNQAFARFLGNEKPAYVPRKSNDPQKLINLIHGAGGLAVWAHPYYTREDDLLYPLLEAGLDGIECFHSKFSEKTSEHYTALAEQHGLFTTGGSDYHGTLEESFELGDWWMELESCPLPLAVEPGTVPRTNS